jgi:uncharacterized protein YecT (DUF1311 family)
MTIDPSKNMDIDAILEDLYRSEINASILWTSPGRGFHATLGAQRLWVQYRDANCAFYGVEDGSIRQVQAAEFIRSMTEDRAHELENAMKFD